MIPMILLLLLSVCPLVGGIDALFSERDVSRILNHPSVEAFVEDALLECSSHRLQLTKPVQACDRVALAEKMLRYRAAFSAAQRAGAESAEGGGSGGIAVGAASR